MKIIRNGVDYELTKQELFEASEAYAYEQAKEIVTERAHTEIDNDVSAAAIEAGIEAYLNTKDCGCDEDFCLSEAIDAVRRAYAENLSEAGL